MHETTTYDCPTCHQPRQFEPILDLTDRRTDTDERACTVCGTGLFVDPALDLEARPARSRRVA